MAITHVGSHLPDSNTNTTEFTISVTTDVLANDILILSCTNRDSTSDPSTPTDNESGGNAWAKIISGNTGASNASVWWKRVVADNTSTITVTGSGFTGSCAAVLSIYRGCSTAATPYEDAATETNTSGINYANSSGAVSPSEANCLVCLSVFNGTYGISTSVQAATYPSSLDERGDHLNTGGDDCGCSHASKVKSTSGSTGVITYNISAKNTVNQSITFVILPPTDYTLTADHIHYDFSYKTVLFNIAFPVSHIHYDYTTKTADLYIPNRTTSATLYLIRDNTATGWDVGSNTYTYIDDIDYTTNTDCIKQDSINNTSIWESQLKIKGHTVPKSAGYKIDNSVAGTFCFSYDANRDAAAKSLSCGILVAGDYRWSDAAAVDTTRGWGVATLTDAAYNTGPVTDIRTVSSTTATVYLALKTTGDYSAEQYLNLYSYRLRLKIYRDSHAPHAPGTLRIGGYMLPFDHMDEDIVTPLAPTLSVIYRDSSNATYADGYEESSYVHWVIGRQKVGTGGSAYITSTFYNGTISIIGLPDTYLTINWPHTSSLLASTEYYAKARVYDANQNAGAWSSIMAFTTGPYLAYAWWDDRWTRRAAINFGSDHLRIKKDILLGLVLIQETFKQWLLMGL
jgi:hypothetical protein